MIRFLLVLLAFVSALLAFIFQETVLFVAAGFLLLVTVVMLITQVHEQMKRKRRHQSRTEMSPEDELRARGILAVRQKGSDDASDANRAPEPERDPTTYAPVSGKSVEPSLPAVEEAAEAPRESGVEASSRTESDTVSSEAELREHGILEVRPKKPTQPTLFAEEESRIETGLQPGSESEPLELPDLAEVAAMTPQRRRVEIDVHLPALQQAIGAHTACLIDVDTEEFVYRLRSVVSRGAVDNAGSEYSFEGFFLSDLLAETTVVDIGGDEGLDIRAMGVIRDKNGLRQLVAAPVMQDGLPAAFFVAAFESEVDDSCKEAVAKAADFFSSLYALRGDEANAADSPLASVTREPGPLRLVKSNPVSVQRKIIGEEISRARGKSHPLALALVCLDSGSEISKGDEMTIHEVEAWMRDCLEAVTPDGRVEYFGELGYGILQTRDVTDVEGWVKRAQTAFAQSHGPVKAHPVVGVAMLSEEHQSPDDLQADAFRALRAAYECGDSTILVG